MALSAYPPTKKWRRCQILWCGLAVPGTQIPRVYGLLSVKKVVAGHKSHFLHSQTLVRLPISSSKTCRFHNFLKLFSSPVVFLWVTSRVGCLLKAISIPIFVYSIMSSGRSYHPDFPPLSSPRTGHNPPAAPRCATLHPNLSSRSFGWWMKGAIPCYPGWLDSTPKNIGRPRYTMIS